MSFLLLLRTSLWVREPGWGRADGDAGCHSLCDSDSPDTDIDCYTDPWNCHGYGDVRTHANPLAYAFSHAFSDRGRTRNRDLNANSYSYQHADANFNAYFNANTIGYSRILNYIPAIR